ncbi:MAG TPA: transporter [Chitinophagaceae bacterium]|nr:transporter [Chitinophagaceae bacterium]
MKRIFILALLFAGTTAFACDICGYGVANYNPFLFPQLSSSYLSIAYQHRLYLMHADDGATSHQYYNSVSVTAQYGVSKKLQLIAILPYQFNNATGATMQNRNGSGDATVLANYKLWNKPFGTVKHTVMARVGVKLPTGTYEETKTGAIDDQNFQLGTGSIDYLANASYRVGIRKWIFNAVATYKYNSTNKDAYRYGDMITTGATAIYRKDWDGFSVAPYVQLVHEQQLKDADHHVLQSHSGGQVLYTGGGVDVNTRKIALGVNYQWAPAQNLAEGHITVKPKLSAHLSFML